MSSNLDVIAIVALLARVSVIGAGLACVFMGYRLFVRGVYKGGAGIKLGGTAKDNKASISMNRGGPGLIFALFGMIIIVGGLFVQFGGTITRTRQPVAPSVPKGESSVTERETVSAEPPRSQTETIALSTKPVDPVAPNASPVQNTAHR